MKLLLKEKKNETTCINYVEELIIIYVVVQFLSLV